MNKTSLLDGSSHKIFKALKKTKAGNYFKGMIRFSPYKDYSETTEQWRRALGPSALMESHLKYVYKVAKAFLKDEVKNDPNKFTKKEQKIILLAAVCHDFGEAILNGQGIGDIPDPKKNKYHVKVEQEVFKKVLKSLPLNSRLKTEMQNAYNKVVIRKTNLLYQFFRAVELSDYLMTGLFIYKRRNKTKIIHDRLLIGNILGVDIPLLVKKSAVFPSVKNFLIKNRENISAAFQYSAPFYRKVKDDSRKNSDIDDAWSGWKKFITKQ